jgi:hypothetical protein
MKTTASALVLAPAATLLLSGLLSGGAGGCGGITALLPEDGGTDGHPSSGSGGTSGSSSSSSGTSGSSSSGASGSSSSSSGTSGSSSSGTSGSSSGISSSSSSGGSSSSSGGGPDTGTIYFEECAGTGALCQSPTFDFYAAFGQASGGNQGCTVTTSGSCSAYTCTGTQTNPIGLSAGTLTISGGSIGTGVTVMPDSTNTYTYQANGALFSAGQTLTVRGSGATVPAFGPVSVVAPGLPLLTTPAATGTTYTISTKSDMKVAWTGGVAGAQLIFEGATGNSTSYFTCVWSASLGEATIPQAMLAPLAGQTNGVLIYGQYTATNFSAGVYSISASALPYTGGMATFQ